MISSGSGFIMCLEHYVFDDAEMFTSEVHGPYARTASAWK